MSKERTFHLTVLGRTLEHLGVQMYKHRDAALAELVANAWDAGAERVDIELPSSEQYSQETATIMVRDNGHGMSDEQIQGMYLVLGRNRRDEGKAESGREPMGRKGIGKLSGFGMADIVDIETWRDGSLTRFTLNARELITGPGESVQKPIVGCIKNTPAGYSEHGTKVILRMLKHGSKLQADALSKALARKFGRTVRGNMKIAVNGDFIGDPYQDIEIEHRSPTDGYDTFTLEDGKKINFFYGFSKKSLGTSHLKGFSILVRGRVAQFPPFFFGQEDIATAHHGTKYMFGEIEADFLDEAPDDVISTDRQEIDWEATETQALLHWGKTIVRKALRDWNERQGDNTAETLLSAPDIRKRLGLLDKSSQNQALKIFKILGQSSAEPDRIVELASYILRAFEYSHFHDFVAELENLAENPNTLIEALEKFSQWRVIESRAILEVIKGRVEVINKFHTMIVNNFPETASSKSRENLHDLLGNFPWLINPDWQVLQEETSVTSTLKTWGVDEKSAETNNPKGRYDFLALADNERLIIIEIKRPGHAVEFGEFQRLQEYRQRLLKGHKRITTLLIADSLSFESKDYETEIFQFQSWAQLHERAKSFYSQYRAILEADIENADFSRKGKEVSRTRDVLSGPGAYRSPEVRKQGLGEQDANFPKFEPKVN